MQVVVENIVFHLRSLSVPIFCGFHVIGHMECKLCLHVVMEPRSEP